MRTFLRRFLGLVLSALIIVSPIYAFAAPAEPEQTITRNMTRSERSIRSIISEKSPSIRSTLFREFVNSRMKYVTARSLSKSGSGKWIGNVDIVEELKDEEHVGFFVEQAAIQYSYDRLPKGTSSGTLEIGDIKNTIRFDGEVLFCFSEISLDETALEDTVSLSVSYMNDTYEIALEEHYPNDGLDRNKALEAMAETYAEYAEDAESLQLIDHAVLKLKSYVSNFVTQQRSYFWELYLVHGDSLPAQATLIRYYPATKSVRAYARTLRSYFN